MIQQEIEVILARYLAENLAVPMFIVDPIGDLLFYNESAESILGLRYDETGPMSANEWATAFQPVDPEGNPIEPEGLPLMIAMTKRRPAHIQFWIMGLDGGRRHIGVTAFPLLGQADRFLGAVAVFWEVAE